MALLVESERSRLALACTRARTPGVDQSHALKVANDLGVAANKCVDWLQANVLRAGFRLLQLLLLWRGEGIRGEMHTCIININHARALENEVDRQLFLF